MLVLFRYSVVLVACLACVGFSGCAGKAKEEVRISSNNSADKPIGKVPLVGDASYYGPGFHGKRTANGEVFNKNAMTAAHKTLPFGTMVRVTHRETNQTIVVRINDRYPGDKRVIDLSEGSFKKLSPLERGVIPVKLEILP